MLEPFEWDKTDKILELAVNKPKGHLAINVKARLQKMYRKKLSKVCSGYSDLWLDDRKRSMKARLRVIKKMEELEELEEKENDS